MGCPERAGGSPLALRIAIARAMTLSLAGLGAPVAEDAHVVPVLESAVWHVAGAPGVS